MWERRCRIRTGGKLATIQRTNEWEGGSLRQENSQDGSMDMEMWSRCQGVEGIWRLASMGFDRKPQVAMFLLPGVKKRIPVWQMGTSLASS